MTSLSSAAFVDAALRTAAMRPLAAERVHVALEQTTRWSVQTALSTTSTNTELLVKARDEAPAAGHAWLFATLEQSAGRGRQGRRWFTAPGSALLFSLALPWPSGAQGNASYVTLAAGVALAETLNTLSGQTAVNLKWPNDLLFEHAKLGGVLAELATDRQGQRSLVIGIGINLWLEAAVQGSITQPAAGLADVLSKQQLADLLAQREHWIGQLAAATVAAVSQCSRDGFVPLQARFMQRFAWLNQEVEVIEQGQRCAQGRALGVDGEGRLLVQSNQRTLMFSSGEVSLRPVARLPTSRRSTVTERS